MNKDSFPLPQNIHLYIETTLAFDNIDRLEETLSGGGTSHRVNGIAIQPETEGPRLQRDMYPIVKSGQRSLTGFVDDVHLPIYHAGEKVGPGSRSSSSEVEVPETTQSYIKTIIWILCRLVDSTAQTIPGWTGFNIKTHQTDDILDNNIGYLPTIVQCTCNKHVYCQ